MTITTPSNRPRFAGVSASWLLFTACSLVAGMASGHDFEKLFAKVDSAVVVLYTLERGITEASPTRAVAQPGLGSGVLIDEAGHILTAAHVVQTADLVKVQFVGGETTQAQIISSDPDKDVALLLVTDVPDTVKPVKVGDSDNVSIGEEVFVIGAPYGLSHTLTVGHISARHQVGDSATQYAAAETFQTDAAINRGNSGGPLFNRRGEVIGIVSHIKSQSGGYEGLGFAVTSNAAQQTLFDRRMAWSGLSGVVVSGTLAAALNVPQEAGYLIQKVAANSPASRLGLQPGKLPAQFGNRTILVGGDIILSLEGVDVSPTMMTTFREKTDHMDTGSLITLRVLRAGKVVQISVPLDK